MIDASVTRSWRERWTESSRACHSGLHCSMNWCVITRTSSQRTTSAEGYLFPTTYRLPLHIGARELVRVMTHQFIEQWSPEWQARLDSVHLSRHDLVTLASIIEAEVRYDPDRPFISAVYQNRLRRGMRLEADPTVSYAYGRRLKRVWE